MEQQHGQTVFWQHGMNFYSEAYTDTIKALAQALLQDLAQAYQHVHRLSTRYRFAALLEHVWRVAAPPWREGLDFVLDTRPFFREPGGPKLGLGSSAALAAALAAALSDAAASAGDLYRTAAVAHRHFQDGKGSGVDVAAAVHGGVIGYRMEPPQVERLEWPDGLHFALLWSGRPASTADKLARLGGAQLGKSAAGLRDAAAAVLAAWKEGVAATVLEQLRRYTDTLRRFGAEHQMQLIKTDNFFFFRRHPGAADLLLFSALSAPQPSPQASPILIDAKTPASGRRVWVHLLASWRGLGLSS